MTGKNPKTTVTITQESDKQLLDMVRTELATERGCDPDEIGNIELFRQLALYRLENPSGVNIRLNGGAETVLRAIEESDSTDSEKALSEVAQDSLRLKNRESATSGGAAYSGQND